MSRHQAIKKLGTLCQVYFADSAEADVWARGYLDALAEFGDDEIEAAIEDVVRTWTNSRAPAPGVVVERIRTARRLARDATRTEAERAQVQRERRRYERSLLETPGIVRPEWSRRRTGRPVMDVIHERAAAGEDPDAIAAELCGPGGGDDWQPRYGCPECCDRGTVLAWDTSSCLAVLRGVAPAAEVPLRWQHLACPCPRGDRWRSSNGPRSAPPLPVFEEGSTHCPPRCWPDDAARSRAALAAWAGRFPQRVPVEGEVPF